MGARITPAKTVVGTVGNGPGGGKPPQEFLAFVSDVAQAVAQHVSPQATPPEALAATPGAPEPTPDAADPFFLDEEKVAWDWPDIGGRAIEDLR